MGGKTGWVFGKLVNVKNSPDINNERIDQTIILNNTLPVPIYEGPGEAYQQIKKLPEGTGSVIIQAIANNSHKEIWYKINSNGIIGWLNEKWIDFSGLTPENNIPQYTIQSISWTKKSHGISIQIVFDKEGLYKFESFQLNNPSRSIIEIKNCTLFQEESLLLVNTNGINQIHAFQFSTNPNIVRIAVECVTDMRFVSERIKQKLIFDYADYNNYAGPKLFINGKELGNQLLLKVQRTFICSSE